MLKKLISGLGKKYIFYTILSPIAMFGEVLMENLIPLFMAHIVDQGISRYDIQYVYRMGLIMILATCFSLICGAAAGRLSAVAALGFSRNLRSKLFRKVQSFSFGEMDKFGTGSLVTRLTTDVTNLQNMYQSVIRGMVRAPLMLLGGTIMAFHINSKLAMIFILVVPVIGSVLLFVIIKAYPRFRTMFKKYDLLNTIVQENLTGIRVVKAFVRGEFENEKFQAVAEDVRNAQIEAEKYVVLNAPVMQIAIYSCICATLWFGGNLVLGGNLKTGELVSILTYVTQILMSLMMLSMLFVGFIMSRASISRIMEVLDEEGSEDDVVKTIESGSGTLGANGEKLSLPQLKDGSIIFDHVYFSYDGTNENSVLSDINLTIPSGATVGVIGGTGSSKTTFVSLIPRLYDCLSGKVLVGGIDVKEYDRKVLRKEIAMVLQQNVLFSGTIEENLRWGNENAQDHQLVEACTAADAINFVMEMPEGFNTQLGQSGVNLSGGQKQRLCIARALLKEPKILILDDSTSAVDTSTDLRIRQALRESLPGTTKLIIAQRIASVQDADFIIVLDDGKINGTGTHQQLLESNKIYREVFESQMSKN